MPVFKIKDLMVHVLDPRKGPADQITDCTFGCTDWDPSCICTRACTDGCSINACTCSYCSEGCTHCTCCSNSRCASSGGDDFRRSRSNPAQPIERLGLAELAALREQLDAARKAVDERQATLEASLAPKTHTQVDELEAKLQSSLQELQKIRETLGARPEKK